MRLAALVVAAALAAPAASAKDWGLMNCAKAKAADEKAICADKSLLQKDAVMSAEFTLLKGFLLMGGRGALMDEQHEWLAKRATCGADKTCLTRLYDERIEALDRGFDGARERTVGGG